MKSIHRIYKTCFLLSILMILGWKGGMAQTPNWSVQPNRFIYSMTITGQVKVTGIVSDDENDRIAAFVGEECRGLTQVKYVSYLNDYYVFLMVYSNAPNEDISFKFYDASTNQVLALNESRTFVVNDIVGSAVDPFVFTTIGMQTRSELLSFNVSGQSDPTQMSGSAVTAYIPYGNDKSNLVVNFSVSDSATCWLGSVFLESGVSAINFNSPQTLSVVSEDQNNRNDYSVSVEYSNDIPTGIQLAPNLVDENQPKGTYVGVLSTITADPTETHTYQFVHGAGTSNELFRISNDTLYTSESLNYEEQSSITIKVKTDDGHGGEFSQDLDVQVINLNEAPTDIGLKSMVESIDVEIGNFVGQFFTDDPDWNDQHSYALRAGAGDDHNSWFTISGENLISITSFTIASDDTFKIRVEAMDKEGLAVTRSIEFYGEEMIGVAPTAISLSNNVVFEGDVAPVLVGTLSAEDDDIWDEHHFQLSADPLDTTDNESFSISNKRLYLNTDVNYLLKKQYKVGIRAIDQSGNALIQSFTIMVQYNDGQEYVALSNGLLPENSPEGTVVGGFVSESLDMEVYRVELVPGTNPNHYANNQFSIDGVSLVASKAFNYEAVQRMVLNVFIHNKTDTVYQDVFVFVTDVNEEPESISISDSAIFENVLPGTTVANIVVDDQDFDEAFQFLFDMSNPDNHNDLFELNQNELILAEAVNFEEIQTLNVCLKVLDSEEHTISKCFDISVMDANDAPSDFDLTTFVQQSNIPVHMTVGTFSATDEDANDEHVWTLVDSDGAEDADNHRFYIVKDLLRTNAFLNVLPEDTFKINVLLEDKGGCVLTKSFQISGKQIVGEAPKGISISGNTILDGSSGSVFVGNLGAVDDNEDDLLFELVDPDDDDNAFFYIENGQLFFGGNASYLNQSEYEVEVVVTDGNGNSFTQTLLISIEPNSAMSYVSLSSNTVIENLSQKTVIGFFQSGSVDVQECTFSLPLDVDLETYANDCFIIESNVLCSTEAFNYESSDSMLVNVLVSKNGLSIHQIITIEVVDANDAPGSMVCSGLSLKEDAPLGTVIGILSCVDEDVNDEHFFELATGNGINDQGNDWVSLSGNELRLNAPIDFETTSRFNVYVKATDRGGEELFQSFVVRVENANDPPVVTSVPPAYVLEGSVFIYTITSADSDNDQITTEVLELPDWLSFLSESCIVYGTPENDEVGSHTFTVMVCDGADTTYQKVSFNVFNVNNAPKIGSFIPDVTFYVNRDNEYPIPAGSIYDPDVGDSLVFDLSMENNASIPQWLSFDKSRMVISAKPAGDAKGQYALKLTGTDPFDLQEYIVFNLRVDYVSSDKVDVLAECKVYPNPISNILTIDYNPKSKLNEVMVFDNSGRKVNAFQKSTGSGSISLNFANKKGGFYLVRLIFEDSIKNYKVVKTE